MTKIYLLTAPFDEQAKTGDGQYADSLQTGFALNYPEIPCRWLKKESNDYTIPMPGDATSIPKGTIPSATVLQPVANGNTVISGYQLNSFLSSADEAESVNFQTASPKTPKILLGHNGKLRSLTIVDIYSQQPTKLDRVKVKEIIQSLSKKKSKLLEAVEDNKAFLNTLAKPKSKRNELVRRYKQNKKNIQDYCTLNEYIEAHLANEQFLERHQTALSTFQELDKTFSSKPVDISRLETLTDKLTGVKDFVFNFHSGNLPYDLENDKKFISSYDFDGVKNSVDTIIKELEEIKALRVAVKDRYSDSYRILAETVGKKETKLSLIKSLYQGGFETDVDLQRFTTALIDLAPNEKNGKPVADIDTVIQSFKAISNLISQKPNISSSKEKRATLITELQSLLTTTTEPYVTVNKRLEGFYGKRKLSTSEGFNLAYQANKQDPLKPRVIANIIKSMKPIDSETYIDIHIRPPDCGVFITPKDIEAFQHAGIKVNITIHEYKQNYTRRYLQQYTHDLMRQANTVQFFNELDRSNAIIAAKYGDCDKRNTTEPSGRKKKEREVGTDYVLDQYPVETYDLASKSGLTVASQKLSLAPAHPLDVVKKAPNILSFGTIRPGKGFEEALAIAKLVKENKADIDRKIKTVPVVKLAGDPQDKDLMQQIVEERFGKKVVEKYQLSHPYDGESEKMVRIKYWQDLVKDLNEAASQKKIELNNPFIEIYPWCEPHELLALKRACKYVCRMDDMGMRNNGSAIISVLDVGIVYTKFGSVTDDIYTENGKYGKAVDLGKYRFGKYSLLKLEEDYKRKHGSDAELPKWLAKNPDSTYKRKSESREPLEILNSIIAREQNQLSYSDVTESENYATILEAQKLLTERFTLRNATEFLLKNIGLEHLIAKKEEEPLLDIDPVEAIMSTFDNLDKIKPTRFLSRSCSEIGFFGTCRTDETRLISDHSDSKIDTVGRSKVITY